MMDSFTPQDVWASVAARFLFLACSSLTTGEDAGGVSAHFFLFCFFGDFAPELLNACAGRTLRGTVGERWNNGGNS